jgi:hypothetical protein
MQQQAQDIGATRALAMCTLFIGTAEYMHGQFTGALAHLSPARRLYHELDAAAGEAMALQRMGVVGTALGRMDEARDFLHAGLRLAEHAMMRPHCLVRLYAALGRNRLEAGDLNASLQAVEAGLNVEAEHGSCVMCNVMLYPISSMAFAMHGDFATAQHYAAKAEASAIAFGSHYFLGLTAQVHGMLHGLRDEWAPAMQKLQQAKQEFAAINVIYEAARSDLFRASVLMRRGKATDLLTAGRLLTGVLPTFIKLGSAAMVAQARSAMKQMRAVQALSKMHP